MIKPNLQMKLDKKQIQALELFSFGRSIKSTQEAVRQLIRDTAEYKQIEESSVSPNTQTTQINNECQEKSSAGE